MQNWLFKEKKKILEKKMDWNLDIWQGSQKIGRNLDIQLGSQNPKKYIIDLATLEGQTFSILLRGGQRHILNTVLAKKIESFLVNMVSRSP